MDLGRISYQAEESEANNGDAKLFYTTLVWLLGIGLGI